MAVNTELLDRQAKAIEQELYKRADNGVAAAELAAVLQEYGASTFDSGTY